jgi:hypothetical protein
MFIFTVNWDFRGLWAGSSLTVRIYILVLVLAAVYSLYASVRMELCLRRVSNKPTSGSNDVQERLFVISNRIENLRQMHVFLFLLFGLCWATEGVLILRSILIASVSLSAPTMAVFGSAALFAVFVFAVLLVLHLVQWAVAVRLRSLMTTHGCTRG